MYQIRFEDLSSHSVNVTAFFSEMASVGNSGRKTENFQNNLKKNS